MEQLFPKIRTLKLLNGTVQHFSDEEIATITAKGFTDDTIPFRILKRYFEGDSLISEEYLLIELNKNHPMVEIVFNKPSDKCIFWIDELDNNYLYYKFYKNAFDQISYNSNNKKLRNKVANNPYLFTIKTNCYGVNLDIELQKLLSM